MKLALFDIDKTLIKGSPSHKKAFSVAFREIYGVDTSIDIIQHSGMTEQEIIYKVLQTNNLDNEKIKSKLTQCMESMVRIFNKLVVNDEIVVLPGVKELLKALDNNKVLLGLVTGNLEQIARAKMKKINLNHYFKIGGFGSDHISRTELVKLAISRAENNFNFIFSNNVYLFGDAPQDMNAGKEAGIKTIGVTTGIYDKKQLKNAGASIVVNDLTDTKTILNLVLK